LIIALLKSGFPTKAILINARHISLGLSVLLSGLYILLQINRTKSHSESVKEFGKFFSVCSTTLSTELCTCLHPVLILESLGIAAFLPNQVRIGFIIMMITLSYNIRSIFRTFLRRRRNS
jgi:hypothetical protein